MGCEFPSITVLIPGLKKGDVGAWNQLVEMFQPGLLAKARRLIWKSRIARRVDAEELVNVTFTKAWEKHEALAAQTTGQIAGFLLTTMQRSFIDLCRPTNLEASSPSWFAPAADAQTPSEMLMTHEDEVRLHASLAELSPKHREILVLRHLEGLKFREIAEKLDTTTGSVAGAARDGLKQLTELLNPNEKN